MGYTRVVLVAKDLTDKVTTLSPCSFKVVGADNSVAGVFQTGEDGTASFLLPVGVYEVRAFHFGTDFGPPRTIALLEEAPEAAGVPVNTYFLYGARFRPTDSLDPAICVAHGFFRTAGGLPAKNLDMQFTGKFTPMLVDGAAILPDKVVTKTNEKGWAFVPLLRGGIYHAVVEGAEDTVRTVYVPDARSWGLPDLLYPRIDRVVFTPSITSSVSMRVGEQMTTGAEVYATDGRKLERLTDDANWSVSDSSVLSMEVLSDRVVFRALKVGVAIVSVLRTDRSVPSLPDVAVGNTPVTVTVTA
jgi:hypothetical protein